MNHFSLEKNSGFWTGSFRAMACPCEIIVDTDSEEAARTVVELCANEATRIESMFSRYRDDNIVHQINTSAGKRIEVDEETAGLLDFAAQCFALSDGLFDITSGVLRKAWNFDGSDRIASQSAIDELLPLVGWQNVEWSRPYFTLPADMQIDFGGIGKEYAVDRAVLLAKNRFDGSTLVNFGGDLHASAPPANGTPWRVGIEHVAKDGTAIQSIDLHRGALATSGDTQRYLLKDGVRYSHVLNPKTGWPVFHAPHSVTVASDSCTEAGVLSTLAMLKGKHAEKFLKNENVPYWCQR